MIQATSKSLGAIIPAFGEARSIGTVVYGVLEHLDHIRLAKYTVTILEGFDRLVG